MAKIKAPAVNQGLMALTYVDATVCDTTDHRHYEFDEYGTWGFCRDCALDVTLDQDGYLARHERMIGGWAQVKCPGSRREPTAKPAFEVPAPPLPTKGWCDDDDE